VGQGVWLKALPGSIPLPEREENAKAKIGGLGLGELVGKFRV
jgi:hypothetical protein